LANIRFSYLNPYLSLNLMQEAQRNVGFFVLLRLTLMPEIHIFNYQLIERLQ